MQIQMNKNIEKYKESWLFGLDLRESIYAIAIIASSMSAFFLTKNIIGQKASLYLGGFCAVPVGFLGFYHPYQMTCFQYLSKWWTIHSFKKPILFQTELPSLEIPQVKKKRIRIGGKHGKTQ